MKKCLLIISFLIPHFAYADSTEYFKSQIEVAAKEYKAITGENPPAEMSPSHLLQLTSSLNEDSKNILTTLAAQVDALKSQSVIEKASLLATQSAKKVKIRGSKTIFNFREDSVYEVLTGVDHITDLQLKAGEELTNPPMSGDTVRWNLGIMKSGSSPQERVHIIIKPLEENIETNLLITTNLNVYQIKLKSGLIHMPSVAWNYPEDLTAAMQTSLKKESREEPTVALSQIRFNYAIEGDDLNWKPVRVFDDGAKTFIQMPQKLRVTEAPALFILDEEDTPMIVNYRVKGDYYITDRLFKKAELRVGTKESVSIEFDDGSSFWDNIF